MLQKLHVFPGHRTIEWPYSEMINMNRPVDWCAPHHFPTSDRCVFGAGVSRQYHHQLDLRYLGHSD